jgi:hypothetical protein
MTKNALPLQIQTLAVLSAQHSIALPYITQ